MRDGEGGEPDDAAAGLTPRVEVEAPSAVPPEAVHARAGAGSCKGWRGRRLGKALRPLRIG